MSDGWPGLEPAIVRWRAFRMANLLDDGASYREARDQTAGEIRAHLTDGEVLPKLRRMKLRQAGAGP